MFLSYVLLLCGVAGFQGIRPMPKLDNSDVRPHAPRPLFGAATVPAAVWEQQSVATTYGGGDNDDGDDDEEEDAALIRRLQAEVLAESGVELDQLINPGKVVNLERDNQKLLVQIEACQDGEEKSILIEQLEKNKSKLLVEKRLVMRGWLKNLFVGQSVLAAVISFAMVYDLFPGTHLDLSIQVLGFWMWWLFIIPSMRARKPSNEEKDALNVAFLATPAVSLLMPVFTKDVGIIWWGNLLATIACYVYAYTKPKQDPTLESLESGDEENAKLPSLMIQALKALDYGSGQERGARK